MARRSCGGELGALLGVLEEDPPRPQWRVHQGPTATTHPWCLEGPWWGRIEKSDLTKQKKHWIQRMLGYLMQTAGHFMFFKAQPTTDNMVMYNSRSHGGDEKEDTAAH